MYARHMSTSACSQVKMAAQSLEAIRSHQQLHSPGLHC